MKRIIAGLVLVVVLIAGVFALLACQGGDGSGLPQVRVEEQFRDFTSYADLAERSDLVIVGEVLSQRQEELESWQIRWPLDDPDFDPTVWEPALPSLALHQVYEVRVTHVIQGEATPGDILEVAQFGGIGDEKELVDLAVNPIAVGETYGLILHGMEPGVEPDIFTPTNPNQGIYLLHDDGTFQTIGSGNPIAGEMEELLAPFGGGS